MARSETIDRPIDRLLAEYGESHRNPVNKAIHWIAVPVIFWCVLALLASLPFPALAMLPAWVNWATVVAVLGTAYYAAMSPVLAVGMALWCLACLWSITRWPLDVMPLWQGALIIFVGAWIAQFIGHAIEGKRPSFFKDVQFLLIGPAWLMHFVLRRAGIPF